VFHKGDIYLDFYEMNFMESRVVYYVVVHGYLHTYYSYNIISLYYSIFTQYLLEIISVIYILL
jgi:hypothetical protein